MAEIFPLSKVNLSLKMLIALNNPTTQRQSKDLLLKADEILVPG